MQTKFVLAELVLPAELRPAVAAAKRLPIAVSGHVPRERRPRHELHLAQVAVELAAERMAACVLALLLLRRERLAADRTQVRLPEVALDVLLHGLTARKPAAAVFAAVRLFAGVDADVLHQLERTAQHLSAEVADERRTAASRPIPPFFQNTVFAHVLRQLEALRERLSADRAAERQSEQRLVVSRILRLRISGRSVFGHVVIVVGGKVGIFQHRGSFAFIFRRNFICNNQTTT